MKKSLFLAALLAPALAFAQPKSADDWYKEGETQYNLGDFDKAADAFKQGFTLETNDSKKPAYLYNVAQAYRQAGKCKDAAFFYKRYLSLKDQDTVKPLKPEKRAEIEQKITELEECARTADNIAKKPPDNTLNPNAGNTKPTPVKPTPITPVKPTPVTPVKPTPVTTVTPVKPVTPTPVTTTPPPPTVVTPPPAPTVATTEGEGEGEEDEGETESVSTQFMIKPRTINARFVLGGAKVSMGDVPTGIKAAISITGGYPIVTQGKLSVDVGASLNFTPMPYRNGITGDKETGSLTTAVINGAATFEVAPKIAVRGDLGVGALFFGGLKMGNPFTENGDRTDGALGMFALRIAASADYAITPNLVATVTPLAFTYSPAKSGLRDDVSSILQLDFMLGVGYRM